LTSAGGIAMGWERDFAVSEVPGTIIGLGELACASGSRSLE
jgi:hypothetical protein